MDDLLDQLFIEAERSPLIQKAAKEIFLLRKQVSSLEETVQFNCQESLRRWELFQSAKYKIMELQRELALGDPGPDKTFKIIYTEHVGDKEVRSARIIDLEKLGAWMAEGWLLQQFLQMVDDVKRKQFKGDE